VAPPLTDPMQSPHTILDRLFARTTQGIKLGLDRARNASTCAGIPQNSFNSLHIAGTNGKGSVCMYLESILRHSGVKTGLFTSPHIVRFEERFSINGRPIATQQWLEVYTDLEKIITDHDLTFFEATTLIAFELFKRAQVEWAVIETGLGGRLDATNIIVPRAAIITTLGIDHTEYLGHDLRSIAEEKLGIVKRRVPLIMAQPASPEIAARAVALCGEQESPCIMVRTDEAERVEQRGTMLHFEDAAVEYAVPAIGDYQVVNALSALRALRAVDPAFLAHAPAGLRNVRLPGRFQIVTRGDTQFIFDVGHNPQAAAAFTATLLKCPPPPPVGIVVGIMHDKDYPAMLREYCTAADAIIVTQPITERAASAHALFERIPESYPGIRREIISVKEAVVYAQSQGYRTIAVTGSFYTVGEAMVALGIEPFGD
jgi:dihydrofolate synthase/folylpolyglutamate synthase